MWPGKNVLLWRWLLLFYIYIFCTFIGRAIYLAAAVALFLSLVLLFAMDIHRINAHDSLFFLYPEWASQWDSAYNHHFEAYVCFLSNRISPHSLARTHSPAHLSYSHHSHCNLLFTDFSFFFHILGFAVFFRHRFFIVGGKRVIYSVNGTVFHISGWLRINMHTQNGEAFLPLKAASK